MAESVSFMTLNMVLSLLLFVVSVLFPFFQILFADKRLPLNMSELIMKHALFFNVGCLFIMGAAGQFMYAPEISACLGWSWSPFQYELAFSELCIGILGLLSPIFNKDFWLATTISAVVWLAGSVGIHFYYLLVEGNQSILNASFVIAWNIFVALWVIACYCVVSKAWQKIHLLLTHGMHERNELTPKEL